jgi:DNA-binding CsgD family transcriptional regulator
MLELTTDEMDVLAIAEGFGSISALFTFLLLSITAALVVFADEYTAAAALQVSILSIPLTGKPSLQPDVMRLFGEDTAFSSESAGGEAEAPLRLRDRERKILTIIASGRSIEETACELFLSPATVKADLQRIYRKLGVKDRTAAVAEAIRAGLID